MTRSRGLMLIVALAGVVAVGAFVVQWARPSGEPGANRADLEALRSELAAVRGSGAGLRVGYVNMDTLDAVFMDAVSDRRQRIADKVPEIMELQNAYVAGTMSRAQYQNRVNQLDAELLEANIWVYVSLLDRMIASSSFSDLRPDLREVRKSAQPLVEEAKNLTTVTKSGAIGAGDLAMRLAEARSAYSEFEVVVKEFSAAKIRHAAWKVGTARGFDLVLSQREAVLYSHPAAVTDITSLVRDEIEGYL
ncbi:MAG: OmpH family outer membrane protein [Candidatus Bipolaricaulis sp.]|nr:OmpH family outer membrane protein [Candidatus Bipolaricaulis sp.]